MARCNALVFTSCLPDCAAAVPAPGFLCNRANDSAAHTTCGAPVSQAQGHLFAALRQTRLIPAGASWQELRYSRGGRTDKGVSGERQEEKTVFERFCVKDVAAAQGYASASVWRLPAWALETQRAAAGGAAAAGLPLRPPPPLYPWAPACAALGQVVALLLRSAGRASQPGPVPAASELDYPALLNRVLPKDIRVLGWTDVPEDFSARWAACAVLRCAALDTRPAHQAAKLSRARGPCC